MELVDMLDSKSGDFTVVWVRVPSLVKMGIVRNEGFNPLFFLIKKNDKFYLIFTW